MTTDPNIRQNCCEKLSTSVASKKRTALNGFKQFGKDVKEMYDDINWKEIKRRNFSVDTIKRKFPIVQWLPKYNRHKFLGDMIAGLTVGLTVIPQGLAYAKVAGLSPEYGLYTSFVGSLVYIFLGSAKDITLGPTAVMSLLVGIYAKSPISNDPTFALVLSLICGVIQLGMALFRIGFIVDFVSHPVINSFTSAAGLTIAFGQIKTWFGLKNVPQDFLPQVKATFEKLPETRPYDFLMGFICVLLLYTLKRMKDIKFKKDSEIGFGMKILKKVIWLLSTSRNALIVVLAAVVAAILLQYGIDVLNLTKNIKKGLPSFAPPSFSLNVRNNTIQTNEIFATIGSGFAIVPILGLVELIAIGKVFAKIEKYSIDANQELFALGVSNVIGSFVGAFPVTGSFSRTAVNFQSGVKTTMGGLWTAGLILLAMAFLTPWFYYIPNAALAAVIIMAVIDLIDFSLLIELWNIKKIDIIPWVVTYISCLCVGIEWGIIIGALLSLLMILLPLGKPKTEMSEYGIENGVEYVVLTPNQGFVFPAVEHFIDDIEMKYLSPYEGTSKNVILNITHFSSIDFTAIEGFLKLSKEFALKKKRLILCNIQPRVLEVLQRAKFKHITFADNLDDAKLQMIIQDDDIENSLIVECVGGDDRNDDVRLDDVSTTSLSPVVTSPEAEVNVFKL